jgi:hypothetical protein
MFTRIAPFIFYDSTFLPDDAAARARAEVESWSGWIPAHAGRYKDDRLIESKEIKELRDVLVNRRSLTSDNEASLRIKDAIAEANSCFKVDNIYASRYVVSKYTLGCHIKPHTDTDFFNTSRIYTGVYYLNADYGGGDIYFPKHNISVKPESSSLLVFFSEYLHGITPITSGTRFSIVWFGLAEAMWNTLIAPPGIARKQQIGS